jgi:hypothetical protein
MEISRSSRQHDRPKWHYYELITIKHEADKDRDESQHAAQGRERKYKIIHSTNARVIRPVSRGSSVEKLQA